MSETPREFAYIDWIRHQVAAHPNVLLGIGDDAAILSTTPGSQLLAAVDMLMEGTHFTLPPASPQAVGHKALAVNLSDMAAMAAKPIAALVSVALPQGRDDTIGQEVHAGLQQLADRYNVAIAGGDTNSWRGPLVISVTVLGESTGRGPVRRDGAQPGDWIMVTGSLGGSLAGKHLHFEPRVHEALALNAAVDLHAMIDISDGLSADLHHILEESRVGAILKADAIPISDAAQLADDGVSPLQHAMGDGEDFELLLTLSPAAGRQLLAASPIELRMSHIGEITDGTGCLLRDASGNDSNLPRRGWEHQF